MYIYKVGVVGAGTMGAQIAEVVSYAGVPVMLTDRDETLARRGVESVRAIYQARVDKGRDFGEQHLRPFHFSLWSRDQAPGKSDRAPFLQPGLCDAAGGGHPRPCHGPADRR